jgi:hypothetical protein
MESAVTVDAAGLDEPRTRPNSPWWVVGQLAVNVEQAGLVGLVHLSTGLVAVPCRAFEAPALHGPSGYTSWRRIR